MMRLGLIDKAFLLKRISLFSLLSFDLLLAIADKLGVVSFEAGTAIFTLDQDAHRMYFIAQGKVQIQDNNRRAIAELQVEDFFGDEALFQNGLRCYEARSLTDVVLLTLSRTNLLAIIAECPSVAISFLQAYAMGITFRHKVIL